MRKSHRPLPRPGQRTYLGCAYLYIKRALVDAIPPVRHEIAKDLKAYIDLVVSEALEADNTHVVEALVPAQ